MNYLCWKVDYPSMSLLLLLIRHRVYGKEWIIQYDIWVWYVWDSLDKLLKVLEPVQLLWGVNILFLDRYIGTE
ncbi:hypothetical protein BDV41DRAFT_559359 [Aspergillus transmontanensis]|uniref:Uncharacterized protein n=1 Tax=Aspergillus transmontanensis TaxID=1034304 RepID=A0A5N6VDJ4_9EURO|nr:hypothetical protein BDV41DRAFT_559359 [Aspergillus transmontanensis]